MSKAYICDKCGAIRDAGCDGIHAIWTTSPNVMKSYGIEDAKYHLCDKCFEKLEREFFENLNEEAGA